VVRCNVFFKEQDGKLQIGVCDGAVLVLGGDELLHYRNRKLGIPLEWRSGQERGWVRTARLFSTTGAFREVDVEEIGNHMPPHTLATCVACA
jgi:hypothetical protein